MTISIPPLSALLPLGSQPSAESLAAAGEGRVGGQPVAAVVVAITRHGPLIEAAGHRWRLDGAPPLPRGATLALDFAAAVRREQPGRLLAVADRMLEPPVAVRLQPVATMAERTQAAEAPPVEESALRPGAGVQVEARPIGPDGRPGAAPAPVWIAAATGHDAEPAAPPAQTAGAPPASPPPPVSTAAAPAPGTSSAPVLPGQAAPLVALPAEVIDRDREGRLLLQTTGLTLRLETPLDLPIGARLQLVLPQGFASLDLAGEPELPAADAPLRVLIDALAHQASAAGGHRSAPDTSALRPAQPDHALAAQLLRWVQLLRAGATPPEPGGGTDASGARAGIESGALRTALAELGPRAQEPQAGGWRILLMPLGTAEPAPLRLYLRAATPDPERRPKPGRDRSSGSRRAVFELEFSHLGRCQLDALCQARRFDLLVRTEAPLDAALQQDIRALFTAARDVAGLSGQVEFRAAELLTLPDPLVSRGHQLTA